MTSQCVRRWTVVGAYVTLVAWSSACEGGAADDQRHNVPLPTQDSLATAREIQASVSGDMATGAPAYSFRGLYAGMTRARVEMHAHPPGPSSEVICHQSPPPAPANELSCAYDVVLGPDSAHVGLAVQYGAPLARGERVARTVAVTRELPLDVDGVRLARALADVFEAQTTLLDKRDASYGRHQAQVRMGTVNGTRKNYVDLSVMPRGSRELLTVKLSRP